MSNAVAKLDFDREQMAVIESQFFPQGATKAEQAYCFSVARELCLNPITREIFFVKRRQKIGDQWINKVEPMVGRDGFLSIAHRTNQLAGIETTVCIHDVPQLQNGKWVTTQQLVAECTVWRKDSNKPFTAQVSYNEYCQKTDKGQPTRFWAEKPETMLKKVAESQALRKAFNIHGVYSPEELGAGFELTNGDIVTPAIEAEYSRTDPEKSHLSSVKKVDGEKPKESAKETKLRPVPQPQQRATPPATSKRPQVAATADQPAPKHEEVIDPVALEVIALLDAKRISYDISFNGTDGVITANSYNEKAVLKSSGFRWSPDQKRWIFPFKNEPF
ncbi:phage recombination protein Bet [Geomonas edaphica]|uniref:phage recombination protein Bet n=1 Tax=Geomonas edaphica TaxID=2570226 RepID=UPI0010A91A9B|nr:phage recombination protein Bet [Geomonas edaphica]